MGQRQPGLICPPGYREGNEKKMARENDEPVGIFELEENLSSAEKPPELPNGTYKGEVQNVTDAIGQTSMKPRWDVQFRIPADEVPPDMREYFSDGVLLTYSLLVKPVAGDRRALYNLKQFYRALGLDPNINAVDPNEWMNQTANLIIKQRPYQGEMRAGITGVEVADEEEAAPAPKRKAGGRK